MNILVLGGSSFFGKKLVRKLIHQGNHEITIATRGIREIEQDISSKLRQIVVDRTNANAMKQELGTEHFDVIYDQICFNPLEAQITADLFAGRVKRYIFTSSMAVYDGSFDILEEHHFNPYTYAIDLTHTTYDYKEGKRQAEAYFYQNASFPVVAVRPPFVIDSHDKRFLFHLNKIIQDEPISLLESSTISLVSAEEVADFLVHIGTKTEFRGPINANNTGFLNTEQLANEIGKVLNKMPVFDLSEEKSPYCIGETLKISNKLARSTGFSFKRTTSVIGELVEKNYYHHFNMGNISFFGASN